MENLKIKRIRAKKKLHSQALNPESQHNCRAVSITDNLCTKQGNSSIFGPNILGL